jgi:hypothetical protein
MTIDRLLQKQRHHAILLLYLRVQYNVLHKYFFNLTTLGGLKNAFLWLTFLQTSIVLKYNK